LHPDPSSLDQILAWNRSPQIRNILSPAARVRKCSTAAQPPAYSQARSSVAASSSARPGPRYRFGRAPSADSHFSHPSFSYAFSTRARHLVSQLLDFVPHARISYVLDVAVFLARFIPRLRPLLQRPVEARGKRVARIIREGSCPERVVCSTRILRFDVGHSINGSISSPRSLRSSTRPLRSP